MGVDLEALMTTPPGVGKFFNDPLHGLGTGFVSDIK